MTGFEPRRFAIVQDERIEGHVRSFLDPEALLYLIDSLTSIGQVHDMFGCGGEAVRRFSRLVGKREPGDVVGACHRATATQTNPTAPVMMKDQRHDNVSISQATAGAPSASPRVDPEEIAAIAVPRSV